MQNPQTFHSIAELTKHADGQLDHIDTISFDIFDTLFIRRVPNPDMVKIPVAQLISDIATSKGIVISPHRVRQLRNSIEARHRQENGVQYPDHEAHYDEFMQETLKDIFSEQYTAAIFEQIADYEISMESAMIVVREAFVEWIKLLHAQGKKLLLISDIYLPARYLERLANEKGLSPYIEKVYSSADSFNAKASGTAYPLIHEEQQLDYDRWMHIGDNPISDGLRPAEHGIEALVIKDIGEHHRLSIATRYNHYASYQMVMKGRNAYQWMLPLEAENQDRDPLYTDGYGFIGFLLCNFIHRLVEKCNDEDIQHVYFCAREGWILKQIWDAFTPWFYPMGNAPKASYLYVSRMGLAATACAHKGLTAENATVARFPSGNRDFTDLARIFKLDAGALESHFERYGISTDSAIGFNSADFDAKAELKFQTLLEDQAFQDDIKAQTKAPNEALQLYLEEQEFFQHDRIALVDIGWLGTIQNYVHNAIGHREDTPQIFGYMLGALHLMPYQNNSANSFEGLIHDEKIASFFPGLTTTFKPVLEEVCRAPHPTLVAYEVENGASKLVFRTTEDIIGKAETQQSEYYQPLHQAIIDLAHRYAPAVQIYKYHTGDMRPWLNMMYLGKVAFPKTEEVLRVRHQAHQDDFQGSGTPTKQALKNEQTLWTASETQLKFNPLLRISSYLNHIFSFIKR